MCIGGSFSACQCTVMSFVETTPLVQHCTSFAAPASDSSRPVVSLSLLSCGAAEKHVRYRTVAPCQAMELPCVPNQNSRHLLRCLTCHLSDSSNQSLSICHCCPVQPMRSTSCISSTVLLRSSCPASQPGEGRPLLQMPLPASPNSVLLLD